jgi:hypothetical protein
MTRVAASRNSTMKACIKCFRQRETPNLEVCSSSSILSS